MMLRKQRAFPFSVSTLQALGPRIPLTPNIRKRKVPTHAQAIASAIWEKKRDNSNSLKL